MDVTNAGKSASDDAGGKSAGAARWNDPKLAAQALLTGSVPSLVDSLPAIQPPSATAADASANSLESAGAAAKSAAAARWSDPKLAAQALLKRERALSIGRPTK